MNREEMIKLARESGLFVPHEGIPENGAFMRFAYLVAAKEREACAQVADTGRKPLTDEQIDRLDCVTLHMPDYERFEVFQPSVIEFARAIEAAHGIK